MDRLSDSLRSLDPAKEPVKDIRAPQELDEPPVEPSPADVPEGVDEEPTSDAELPQDVASEHVDAEIPEMGDEHQPELKSIEDREEEASEPVQESVARESVEQPEGTEAASNGDREAEPDEMAGDVQSQEAETQDDLPTGLADSPIEGDIGGDLPEEAAGGDEEPAEMPDDVQNEEDEAASPDAVEARPDPSLEVPGEATTESGQLGFVSDRSSISQDLPVEMEHYSPGDDLDMPMDSPSLGGSRGKGMDIHVSHSLTADYAKQIAEAMAPDMLAMREVYRQHTMDALHEEVMVAQYLQGNDT